MRAIIFLIALIPSIALAQLSPPPYNPANVNITGGKAAFTGDVSTTGSITSQGNVIATGAASKPVSVTQPSVQMFTGSSGAQTTIAYVNPTLTANNRIAYSQWGGGSNTFVVAGFVNDSFAANLPAIQVSGGNASGITGILSNSGTGSWTHTGDMAVSGQLLAGSGTLNVYSSIGTAVTTPHVVTGTVTLASGNGTATFTGNAVFSNTTSYACTATNTSTNSAVRATNASASSVTFNSGASTDVIAYQCIGN
jgi:hypothetical protein